MRDYVGAGGLLAAIKAGEELEDSTWAKLYDQATAYERRCARLILDPDCAPHGVPGTYTNWGCRCDPCTEAHSNDRRGRRTREDFPDAPPDSEDTTPAQIVALRAELAAGRELTPKGQAVLDAWEAQQVL
jgi:hypothetical protein